MDKELKLEKEVKKLYVGYEDRNTTNKKLFKLAKRTIKKGLSSFDYVISFDLDEPIEISKFEWSMINLKNYGEFINNHLHYLNDKFNGYFKFKIKNDIQYRIIGFYDKYEALVVTFTIHCDKICEEEN